MFRTLMICTTLALAACASTPGTPTAAKTDLAKNAAANKNCITSASRIPQNNCSAPGHTYTQDDIDRTGQTNVAQALQMLDPSISAH